MKSYRQILDFVLLAGLAVIALATIAPKTIVMPSSMQMLLLAIVLGLATGFVALVWREQPNDEREAHNQALASRVAYLTGVVVLIVSIVIQSSEHRIDSALPIALLAMIATKLFVQRNKDGT